MEDVVDAFSQSFSPFLLLERLGDRKPSAESGLRRTRVEVNMSNLKNSLSRRIHHGEKKTKNTVLSQILGFN